ncbi:hypothetical protein N7U49_02150 [Streptomyces sp. AD2-2]|nr:hypothetical protein N7U49_02150 [Streptomyces sp. AD2-2]
MKDVITRIAWKNHVNGARNPRAQFRKEVPLERIRSAPIVAGMLGVFDCSGSPTVRRRRSSYVPRTPTSTPTRRSS